MRTALVTGVGGQDGLLLARELAAHDTSVLGTVQTRGDSAELLATYAPHVRVLTHDVTDRSGFARLLDEHRPDEVYNLAALSSVGASWQAAEQVAQTNGVAVLRMLEELVAHRARHGWAPRFFQASTAEMFGRADHQPQSEMSAHRPRNPYAAAKSFAHHLTSSYRDTHDLWACSGILYSHESPLRPESFVTRKISRAAAEISLGRRDQLRLGSLDVRRDWGAASDHVRAMRLMLGAAEPADYVIATGASHSLEELVVAAFAAAGVDDPWRHVRQDPELVRPAEVAEQSGDPTRAREQLGWSPTLGLEQVIEHMVRVDLTRLESGVEESPAYLSPLSSYDAGANRPLGRR